MLSELNDKDNYKNTLDNLHDISNKYNIGGCFIWEYCNSPSNTNNHNEWSHDIYNIINKTNNCILF